MTNKTDMFDGVAVVVIAVLVLIVVGIAIAILTIPIHAILLMIAWNYALTTLFKLPEISFWQSIALVIIARILLKSSVSQTANSHKS
jgi:hypothetical protein